LELQFQCFWLSFAKNIDHQRATYQDGQASANQLTP
jgi:hypothetical protein